MEGGGDQIILYVYWIELHDFSQLYSFSHITLRRTLGLFIFRQCDVFYFLIVAFSTPPRTRRKTLKVSLEERSKVSSTQSHHYCW